MKTDKPEVVKTFRLSSTKHKVADLCYLQGAQCSGCTVSFANFADPDLIEIFRTCLEKPVPTWDIGLPYFYPTVMPTAGKQAVDIIDAWKKAKLRVLIVEGAIPRKGYCEVGGRPFEDVVAETVEYADVIIAYGTCAAYGGMTSANPNPSGGRGVKEFLEERHINKRVISLPGCPAHPDWLVLTIAAVLEDKTPSLDKYGRPRDLYGRDIHQNECPRRGYYEAEEFAESFGVKECLFKLGCRGSTTKADCPARLWNNTAFCVNSGGPCIGCTHPGFPDQMSPFYVEKEIEPEVEPLFRRSLQFLSGLPSNLLNKVQTGFGILGPVVFVVRSILKDLSGKEEK